jgi:hypothetical protein
VGHPYWCEFYFDAEGELFYFDKSNRHYTAMWEEEDAKSTKDTKEQITRATDAEKKLALYKELNQIMPTEVSIPWRFKTSDSSTACYSASSLRPC